MQTEYRQASPFRHIVIEDFFLPEIARQLTTEFPPLNWDQWRKYDNAIENKKLINHWDKFGGLTYRVFEYLCSPVFLDHMKGLTEISNLEPDPGLNGGGLHVHGPGGKLNVHLDYSVHPKLKKERRINLLVYLSADWLEAWGGHLEFWTHDTARNKPGQLARKIECRFNRAVIFDTTQNSWHGLPEPLTCPAGVTRKSLAIYYVTEPRQQVSERGKALFAPTKAQENDPVILELIQKRANVETAASVYE